MNELDIQRIRSFCAQERSRFKIDSSQISDPDYHYVAWVDIMGAGSMMATSSHKSANFLSRIHMAIADSTARTGFEGKVLAINDGCYLASRSKFHLLTTLQHVMMSLSSLFIATPNPKHKFMVRGGIAFGPVYSKVELQACFSRKFLSKHQLFLDQVLFGPPIIQAYLSESAAVPFGIAVHESARAFAGPGETPFSLNHWFWWQKQDGIPNPPGTPPLGNLATVLRIDLCDHLDWMAETNLFNGLPIDKIKQWQKATLQYFASTTKLAEHSQK